MKYLVLWIDDKPNDSFIVDAEAYDLDIHVEKCYNRGIEWLRANQDICMAVILDVKCKITEDPTEVDTPDAFIEKWTEVVSLCSKDSIIPWFVYTSGDYQGIEALNLLPANKLFDQGHKYYNKPADRTIMLANIQRAIENRDIVAYYKKYESIVEFCPQMARELFRVITIVEKNEFTNTSAFNDMRKILGWSVQYMREHGLFPDELRKISQASYYIRTINTGYLRIENNEKQYIVGHREVVPNYIRLAFETCADTCNNGSHGEMEGSIDETNNLVVDKAVKNGKAPYLIRSTFYELLDILQWCKKLPVEEGKITSLRNKVADMKILFDPNK